MSNERPENLVDLLNQLVPPPEPDPISLFPVTAGWYIVGSLLLVAVAALIFSWLKRHKANAYRRSALAALPVAGRDSKLLAVIVRQTALAAFPRQDVASLYGEAWLEFLNNSCEGEQFRAGLGEQIARGPYDPSVEVSSDLIAAVQYLIANHKRGAEA